jgi:hypothetical protein
MAKKKLITKSEWSFFWKMAAVLMLITAVVTALITYFFLRPEEALQILPKENPFEDTGAAGLETELLFSDFYFTDPGGSFGERSWSFNKEIHPKWSPEDVMRYWQDP